MSNDNGSEGLSLKVIIISGIIVAFFILAAFLMLRNIAGMFSFSDENFNRLLKKREYEKALVLLDKNRDGTDNGYEYLVKKGKIYMSIAWENANKNNWADYGKDEDDWFVSEQIEKAGECFEKALEIREYGRDAHYYLGLIYMEKGWFSHAESEFLSVLRKHKDDMPSRINLGVIYSKKGDYRLAKKEFLECYQRDKENPTVLKNLAVLYRYYLDKPDSAMIWANRYLNEDPSNDYDKNIIRNEMNELLQRYPEADLPDDIKWKKKKEFKVRKLFGMK